MLDANKIERVCAEKGTNVRVVAWTKFFAPELSQMLDKMTYDLFFTSDLSQKCYGEVSKDDFEDIMDGDCEILCDNEEDAVTQILSY